MDIYFRKAVLVRVQKYNFLDQVVQRFSVRTASGINLGLGDSQNYNPQKQCFQALLGTVLLTVFLWACLCQSINNYSVVKPIFELHPKQRSLQAVQLHSGASMLSTLGQCC